MFIGFTVIYVVSWYPSTTLYEGIHHIGAYLYTYDIELLCCIWDGDHLEVKIFIFISQ